MYSWRLEPTDTLPVGKLVEHYLATKIAVKPNTLMHSKFVQNVLKGETFNDKKISQVKTSDAKQFLIKFQQDGRRYSTVKTVRGVLRPAFQMSVDDDVLLKIPFGFELAGVVVNDSVTREAITKDQMQYIIEPPKTDAGIRVIPMQEEVCECFRRIIQNRRKPKAEPMVGGKVGFLYLDKNEMPKITPHVCRHAYCSYCASSGRNPKYLQYLMGHSDISVTLNTYTHEKSVKSGMPHKTRKPLIIQQNQAFTEALAT